MYPRVPNTTSNTSIHIFSTQSHLPCSSQVFGCTSFVHNTKPTHSKPGLRSFKCIFLGYSPNQKAYKCYSSTNKVCNTMDVTFFKDQPFSTKIDMPRESVEEYQFLANSDISSRPNPVPQPFKPLDLPTPTSNLLLTSTNRPSPFSDQPLTAKISPLVQTTRSQKIT